MGAIPSQTSTGEQNVLRHFSQVSLSLGKTMSSMVLCCVFLIREGDMETKREERKEGKGIESRRVTYSAIVDGDFKKTLVE